MTYHNLFYVTDDDLGKLAWCEQALVLRRQIVEKNPGNAYHRNNLARTYQILGLGQFARGLKNDGLKSLHESHRLLQQVVVDDPRATMFHDNLGCVCESLGSSLAQQGRIKEAVACLEQARADLSKTCPVQPRRSAPSKRPFVRRRRSLPCSLKLVLDHFPSLHHESDFSRAFTSSRGRRTTAIRSA